MQQKVAVLQRHKLALEAKVAALENAAARISETSDVIAETAEVLSAPAEKLIPAEAKPEIQLVAEKPQGQTVAEKIAAEKPVVPPVEKPVIAPVQSAPPPAAPQKISVEYTVKSGDTLGKIARRYYGAATRYAPIMKANQLTERSVLRIGQKLIVPDVDPKRAGGR